MRDTQKHGRRAKHLQTLHWCMSSVKDVSHLSRRAKRRMYCKVQLWMWRKRRERCRYAMFRATRRACLVGVHTRAKQSDCVSPVGCQSGNLAGPIKWRGGLQQLRECGRKPEVSATSAVNSVRATVVHYDKNANHPAFSQSAEARLESCPQGETSCSKEATAHRISQQLKEDGTFEHNSGPVKREQAAAVSTVEGTISAPVYGGGDLHSLKNGIQGEFWKLV